MVRRQQSGLDRPGDPPRRHPEGDELRMIDDALLRRSQPADPREQGHNVALARAGRARCTLTTLSVSNVHRIAPASDGCTLFPLRGHAPHRDGAASLAPPAR
jgi:hypothetical protein